MARPEPARPDPALPRALRNSLLRRDLSSPNFVAIGKLADQTHAPVQANWTQETLLLLERLAGAPFGTTAFWVSLAVALGIVLLLGWVLANFLFAAKRGILICFLGQLLPALAGGAGWVAVRVYAVPELQPGVVREWLPWGGAGLAALLGTLLLTRWILGVSELRALLSVVLTYGGVIAFFVFAGEYLPQAPEEPGSTADGPPLYESYREDPLEPLDSFNKD